MADFAADFGDLPLLSASILPSTKGPTSSRDASTQPDPAISAAAASAAAAAQTTASTQTAVLATTPTQTASADTLPSRVAAAATVAAQAASSGRLGNFLTAIRPLVLRELQQQERGRAARRGAAAAAAGLAGAGGVDDGAVTVGAVILPAAPQQQQHQQSVSGKHADAAAVGVAAVSRTVAATAVNATGGLVAVAYGDCDHTGWCEHKSLLTVTSIHGSSAASGPKDRSESKLDSTADASDSNSQSALSSTSSSSSSGSSSSSSSSSSLVSFPLPCCATALAFHPTFPTLLAVGLFNGEVRLLDFASLPPLDLSSPLDDLAHREPVAALAWAPLPSAAPLAPHARALPPALLARGALSSPCLLASTGGDGRVLLWDATLGLRTWSVGAALTPGLAPNPAVAPAVAVAAGAGAGARLGYWGVEGGDAFGHGGGLGDLDDDLGGDSGSAFASSAKPKAFGGASSKFASNCVDNDDGYGDDFDEGGSGSSGQFGGGNGFVNGMNKSTTFFGATALAFAPLPAYDTALALAATTAAGSGASGGHAAGGGALARVAAVVAGTLRAQSAIAAVGTEAGGVLLIALPAAAAVAPVAGGAYLGPGAFAKSVCGGKLPWAPATVALLEASPAEHRSELKRVLENELSKRADLTPITPLELFSVLRIAPRLLSSFSVPTWALLAPSRTAACAYSHDGPVTALAFSPLLCPQQPLQRQQQIAAAAGAADGESTPVVPPADFAAAAAAGDAAAGSPFGRVAGVLATVGSDGVLALTVIPLRLSTHGTAAAAASGAGGDDGDGDDTAADRARWAHYLSTGAIQPSVLLQPLSGAGAGTNGSGDCGAGVLTAVAWSPTRASVLVVGDAAGRVAVIDLAKSTLSPLAVINASDRAQAVASSGSTALAANAGSAALASERAVVGIAFAGAPGAGQGAGGGEIVVVGTQSGGAVVCGLQTGFAEVNDASELEHLATILRVA